MRAVIAIETSHGDTLAFEITQEMLDKEPNLAFKLGELQGAAMKHGGEVTWL